MKTAKKLVPEEERTSVIKTHHDLGHFGSKEVIRQIIKSGLHWPTMHKDVQQFCKECLQCLRYNITRQGFHPMRSILAKYPWDHLLIDLAQVKASCTSRGMNFILIIVDICTRFVILRAIADKSALTVAWTLWQVFADFGNPLIVQADNGREFANRVAEKLAELLGYEQRFVLPYNPRANGAVERQVRTAKDVIFKKIDQIQKDRPEIEWDMILPGIQSAMNIKIARATNTSPQELMFARPRNMFAAAGAAPEAKAISPEQLLKRNEEMVNIVFPAIYEKTLALKAKQRKAKDKTRKLMHDKDFAVGTVVMRVNQTAKSKAARRYHGPYSITKVKDGKAWLKHLDPDAGDSPKRPFPFHHLKWAYNPIDAEKQDMEDDNPAAGIYAAEAITKHRVSGGKIYYLVKWHNYSDSEATWEPVENCSLDTSLIDEYWTSKGTSTEQGTKTALANKKKRKRRK